MASGVPSLPLTPVPPVVRMAWIWGSAIQGATVARIWWMLSGTICWAWMWCPTLVARVWRRAADLSVAGVRVSEAVRSARLRGMNLRGGFGIGLGYDRGFGF